MGMTDSNRDCLDFSHRTELVSFSMFDVKLKSDACRSKIFLLFGLAFCVMERKKRVVEVSIL